MAVARALAKSVAFWILVGVLAATFVVRGARDALARDTRFLAVPAFQEARGPAWAGPEAVRPVLERLEDLGPINLFAPELEERVRRALDAVPIVREVGAVKRLWPRRYAVEFRIHRPVAVVHFDGARIPVDATGIALPAAPYTRAVRGLLRITGLDAPPPRPGQVWPSAALADGLATVAQLEPYRERLAALGLATVDVSQSADPRRGVRVLGRDAIVVRWGRPRAEVGENSVADKVAYLAIAAGNLDRVRGFEVDVRFDTLYLREAESP